MAKTSNGLGKFSGKLGGAVFVIRNGQQIVREYNPRPSNPKSDLQTAQRAKGNLAGRISSFTPKAAIFGLGNNASARRSRFLKLLLSAAVVTKIDNDWNAKIPWENLLFSEGTIIAPFSVETITARANAISVSLRGFTSAVLSAEEYAAYSARLVVMVYDQTSQDLIEVATRIITKPAQGDAVITEVLISHPQGYTAAVYLIPMSSNDGSALAITSDMANMDDAQVAATLSRNANNIAFNYGRSVLLGSSAYAPALGKTKKKEV